MGTKRLFIGNLTEDITEDDLRKEFNNYGVVQSIDIKPKKTNSGIIAFMNIDIDDRMLKQCINEFKSELYHGVYLNINIAKETFLEKLKRERELEAALNPLPPNKIEQIVENEPIKELPKLPSLLDRNDSSSSESSDSSEEEIEVPKVKKPITIYKPTKIISNYDPNDIIVKKSSRSSMNASGQIKIELETGLGGPINCAPLKEEKQLDSRAQQADAKRLESLNKMKEVYNQQKLAIKNALAKVDTKQKITSFEENNQVSSKQNNNNNKSKKPDLFDEEDNENYDNDFRIREQYEGASGEKLLQLQTHFRNDKRFQMDKTFLDQDNDNKIEENNDTDNNERNWQMGILEGVVGKKLQNNSGNQVPEKTMLRYDPTRKDHTKYLEQNMMKNKQKNVDEVELDVDEIEVSKETFYKVNDDFSKSLKNKQGFSLLNMFGVQSQQTESKDYKEVAFNKGIRDTGAETNPFKYDSTDDEYQEELPKIVKTKKKWNTKVKVFRETLFLLKDDPRYQEGAELFRNENIIDMDYNTLKKVVKRKINKHENFYGKNEKRKKYNKKKYNLL